LIPNALHPLHHPTGTAAGASQLHGASRPVAELKVGWGLLCWGSQRSAQGLASRVRDLQGWCAKVPLLQSPSPAGFLLWAQKLLGLFT